MRKVAVGAAVAAVMLVCAAVVFAAQVNTYTVTGSTSPAKAGSKQKPVPLGLNFDYTVGEEAGQRPSPVSRYTIGFYGMQSNGGLFPKCTAAQINAAQSDKGCAQGSLVGSGSVTNAAGASNNPADTSIPCNLGLRVYNGGQGKAAIYLFGNPPQCVIPISQAIDARYVSAFGGKGSALQFSVPANLLHPVSGIDNAVTNVQSNIKKLTKRSKGRTRGYFESVRCQGGKRPITVDFLTEAGQSSTASADANC
ncbi:hypothetical protein [Capillimicrobium parvum]|uniref:Uncharacterized protein n=1 Tax=Capillimicrobium parvum TaxID=2884022 RepID=A0A9E6Y049_9ACTN|nr:hypothetical protein [Capillimicrobium parvum]UGS37727.1 hypothetical protein DSM104329_04148 [Capillimicrobium parvum]